MLGQARDTKRGSLLCIAFLYAYCLVFVVLLLLGSLDSVSRIGGMIYAEEGLLFRTSCIVLLVMLQTTSLGISRQYLCPNFFLMAP
jgi:hypothetical protein